MTANIRQHVIQRQRQPIKSFYSARPTGRRQAGQPRRQAGQPRRQAGNINSATTTLALGIVIIISAAFLSFFYLNQVVGTASQNTDIQDMEKQISELREKQRELELEGAHLRSIKTIEQQVKQLNLVTTDKVTYLVPRSDHVAALSE